MPEPSTELTVLNPTTAELVDLHAADTEVLACMIHELADSRAEITAFEGIVEQELLARMDRSAQWTHRVGDFELKAASPTAGTEEYRIDQLETELSQLVADGTVTSAAASVACRRLLTLALEVPWDASPNELAEQVKQAVAIEVDGHKVRVVSAAGSARAAAAGIKALRKVPGVSDVLDRVKVEREAPRRRVRVTHRGSQL
jgi:hypothetical protein